MDLLEFLAFTLFSSFEYIAFFIFVAVLFRFRYFLKMKMHILMVCLLLSYISYTTRMVYDLTIGSSLIQFGLMILFIWLLFRVQVFYAVLITLSGFTGYSAVQLVFLFLFDYLNIFSSDDLKMLRWPSYILPISSSIVFYAISWIILKKNWGFSFVPDSYNAHVKLKKENILLLGIISLVFLFVIILHGLGHTLFVNIYASSIFYIIAFAAVIIFSIRREQDYD